MINYKNTWKFTQNKLNKVDLQVEKYLAYESSAFLKFSIMNNTIAILK